jgi:hypothetical protein
VGGFFFNEVFDLRFAALVGVIGAGGSAGVKALV